MLLCCSRIVLLVREGQMETQQASKPEAAGNQHPEKSIDQSCYPIVPTSFINLFCVTTRKEAAQINFANKTTSSSLPSHSIVMLLPITCGAHHIYFIRLNETLHVRFNGQQRRALGQFAIS